MSPLFFVTILAVLCGGLCLVVCQGFRSDYQNHPVASEAGWSDAIFLVLLLAAMLWCRWPTFLPPFQYNPDESFFMAGGLTFWRNIPFTHPLDGGTSSIFNFAIQGLPYAFGLPFNYVTARAWGIVMIWIGISAVHLLCRRQFQNRGMPRLAMIPVAGFYAGTGYWDYLHTGGEIVPLSLLCVAIFCLFARNKGRRTEVIAGCILAAAVFSKLQILPSTALLVLFYVWGRGFPGKDISFHGIKSRLTLPAACISFSLLFLMWPAIVGQPGFYPFRYFQMNLFYADQGMGMIPLVSEQRFLSLPPEFSSWHLGIVLSAGLLHCLSLTLTKKHETFAYFAGAFWLVCLFSALFPGRPYGHYHHFIIMGSGIWFAMIASHCGQVLRKSNMGAPRRKSLIAAAVVLVVLIVISGLTRENIETRLALSRGMQRPPADPLCLAIQKYCREGEPIFIWGWASHINVATGTTVAGADINSGFMRPFSPFHETFRRECLAALVKNPPAAIVDASADGNFVFGSREQDGIQSFPALQSWLGIHYELAGDFKSGRLWIFREKNAASHGQ